MQPYRIGIDLGGTKTEILVLDPEENVLLRERTPTRKNRYEDIIDTIHQLYRKAVTLIPPSATFTVGIGIPGIIDPASDLVINANTTILIGKPLRRDLTELFQHEVFVENDANCFALAEAIAGAGKGYSVVFGVIMGTGCGGGIVINRQIHKGRHGIAGEWGHFSIDPEGDLCWCGNRGCIETMISGSGVEKKYLQQTGIQKTMREIVEEARKDIQPAKTIFTKFLDDFGRALGGIISTLDPDIVVLGGGLSNIEELYSTGIENVKKYAFYHSVNTPIVKNILGDSAGVFGAAWLGI